MATSEFTLATGQKAERKLLITVAEWMVAEVATREILGTRTPDSTIEMNADIQTETDIRGINHTDVNFTQPQQDFDPYVILGGSKLGALLNDIRRRNAVSELNQFTCYIVTAFIDTGVAPLHVYPAEMHTGCTIAFTGLGGDNTGINFPISVYFSNNVTLGTIDDLGDDFVFTADV